MTQQTKIPNGKQAQAVPSPSQQASKQKHLAEQNEVAGRHKNDGQKNHKGAR